MAAAAEVNYIQSPEDEIYGRSLGSIRRFGAFIVAHASRREIINSPEAAQAKAEFYTSVEEGFGTDMELGGGLEVRDFDERPIVDGRVMAKDNKTAVSAMTEAGLKCANERVKRESAMDDWRFMPQLIRSKWDHENALTVDKMARGETNYNTRIVISPFPEEGAAQSGDAYWRNIGYVPHLRRGFVQLYHATKDGVVTGSLSFDGSNKGRLKEIFSQFGVEIPEGEITDNWLKYAITNSLSTDEAKALATNIADMAGNPSYKKNTNTVAVTRQYRPLMERAFNESYIHMCESLALGYQTPEARALIFQLADKSQHFNERYASALYKMRTNPDQFTGDDSIVLHELLVYATIEMMRALYLQKTDSHRGPAQNNARLVAAFLQSANPEIFQSMLSGFGAEGAKNNRIVSACGLEINVGAGENPASPQSAYGGQAEMRGNNGGMIRCIKCRQYVPKKQVVKKDCWECPACKHKVDICNGKVLREGKTHKDETSEPKGTAKETPQESELAEAVSLEEKRRIREAGKAAVELVEAAA